MSLTVGFRKKKVNAIYHDSIYIVYCIIYGAQTLRVHITDTLLPLTVF